jgi:methionyl-tRNA formyltransferase
MHKLLKDQHLSFQVLFLCLLFFLVEIINNFNVIAIISQPDRKAGRGKNIQITPVKKLALHKNIKLFQPEKIINIKKELENLNADLLVTCAYGQYIPSSILTLPKYSSINIHASLLPKYRGAAPIHYSILKGDEFTGVTIMKMSKKMDAGNILFADKLKISNKTTSELFLELSNLAKTNITK